METTKALETYEQIAPYYDLFTAHHDYGIWLPNLLAAVEGHGLRGRRLLDVGCGTGKSFLPMLERDWEVTACDLSESMARRARAKAGDRAAVHVADMRELPVLGEFDLVWALDDAVNYLGNLDDLLAALRGMRANLAPGGLLLFDVNVLGAYRTFYVDTEVQEHGDLRLRWVGLADPDAPPGGVFEARFEVERGESREIVSSEIHRHRHFPAAEVRQALAIAGLRCLDVFGQGYDGALTRPLDEQGHVKAVFVAGAADQPVATPTGASSPQTGQSGSGTTGSRSTSIVRKS